MFLYPHQCVTVPKMLNDTDTDTFFSSAKDSSPYSLRGD